MRTSKIQLPADSNSFPCIFNLLTLFFVLNHKGTETRSFYFLSLCLRVLVTLCFKFLLPAFATPIELLLRPPSADQGSVR